VPGRRARASDVKESGPRPCAARALFWGLLLSLNAMMAATVIAAAQWLRRPALYLTATGPLLLVGLLALLIWWDTRRPGRASVFRAAGWATVAGDALVLAHGTVAYRLAGRFGLFVMIGPLILAAVFTLMVAWYRRGALASGRSGTDGGRE
jgi:hypothetical protein